MIELLLDRGANIHADGDEALRYAAKNGQLEVVELLLAQGADLHVNDDASLRLAAKDGQLAVVELLLDYGPTCMLTMMRR